MKRLLSLALALVMVLSAVPATVFATEATPALPTAKVSEITNEDLTFAMNFRVNSVTEEQLTYYGNWYADFELTVNKEVTFNNDGSADGWLAGQYDEWSYDWVTVPFGKFAPVTLEANETMKIMVFAAECLDEPGLKYTFREVYETVKDFNCGVFFDDEFLLANPDLVVTLELKMYNPENESENYVIGETYTYYNPIVAMNTATNKAYSTVMDAMLDCAEDQTVALLKDVNEAMISIFGDTTLDLNGHALNAGYVSCFGDIIDSSAGNSGLLVVPTSRFMIREDNAQLPVRDGNGYCFVEVQRIATTMVSANKFGFQTRIEPSMLTLLKQGQDATGVTIQVLLRWKQGDGYRTQNFVYNDSYVQTYLNSYNAGTDKYSKMFTLTLNGAENFEELTFTATVVSDTKVSFSSDPLQNQKPAGNVTTDANNQVVNDVSISNGGASALVPSGTQLESGANNVTLSATEMERTTSNITLDDGEQMVSMNVHVEGVSANNTKPIIVTLNKLAPEALNQGNLKLYHVENGETVEMTRVYDLAEVDAHNEYYYDIATGTVTMALATFSEIAVVSDTAKAWKGGFDYTWYDSSAQSLVICNADQLAAFGAIVGGMNGQTQDSFKGKTVKLLSDINLGDKENANGSLIFHPIGYYYTDDKNEDGTTGDYYSTVSSFEGIFDGNGHTISNIYQNTWEIKGDYSGNYYSDAMGLFGYVVNGKVMNLTVDNFSSDGEFTPTGVIAAYAVNSTFENIAITNCNPRVYNTGNGGIVGIGGSSNDTEACRLTFTNITIDNTNKITALWGSWDVACGGLVGMFRGAGHVDMINCHVAAQIDVYNDVCGNYQYYWYRYSGMMVGTNENMVTDELGYTVPETDKFHAQNCTVHFGDWNDYYYCELVANSLASYTHDHQFSRLTEVEAVNGTTITYLDGTTGEVPASGWAHYVVVNGEDSTENATCYHFKDGKVHNHEDAGEETVDGKTVLKEDKQLVYLPFNQLFTGYGWGVKHIPVYNGEDFAFDGITILDRAEASSVVKFEVAATAKSVYATTAIVNIGELFQAKSQNDDPIETADVKVFVSPVGDTSTAGGTYMPNPDDWTKGTLSFTGIGAATITITDYNFCDPTSITVNICNVKSEVSSKTNTDLIFTENEENDLTLKLLKQTSDPELFRARLTLTDSKGSFTDSNGDKYGEYLTNITFSSSTLVPVSNYLTRLSALPAGTYNLRVELLDTDGNIRLDQTHTFHVVAVNSVEAQVISATGSDLIFPYSETTLPDLQLQIWKNDSIAETLTYQYTVKNSAGAALDPAGGKISVPAGPDSYFTCSIDNLPLSLLTVGTYTITLTVTDNDDNERLEEEYVFHIVAKDSVKAVISSSSNSDRIFTEGEELDLVLQLDKTDGIAEAFNAEVTLTSNDTEIGNRQYTFDASTSCTQSLSELLDSSNLSAPGTYTITLTVKDDNKNTRFIKDYTFHVVAVNSVEAQVISATNPDRIFTNKDTPELQLQVWKTDNIAETLIVEYSILDSEGNKIGDIVSKTDLISAGQDNCVTYTIPSETLADLPLGIYSVWLSVKDNDSKTRKDIQAQFAKISGNKEDIKLLIRNDNTNVMGTTSLTYKVGESAAFTIGMQKADGVAENLTANLTIYNSQGKKVHAVSPVTVTIPTNGYYQWNLKINGIYAGNFKLVFTLTDDAKITRASYTLDLVVNE